MNDALYKIVLVGDSGVGKTNILSRFTRNEFTHEERGTIGVEFSTRIVNLSNVSKKIKAQVWDTAGQERYRAITNAYYRSALGVVLVYEITIPNSFHNANRWLGEIRDNASEDIVVILFGNKMDLESQRQVSTKEGETFAHDHNLLFLETSAKTGENIDEAFFQIIGTINQNHKSNDEGMVAGMFSPTSIPIFPVPLEDEHTRCCSRS